MLSGLLTLFWRVKGSSSTSWLTGSLSEVMRDLQRGSEVLKKIFFDKKKKDQKELGGEEVLGK